MKEDELCKLQVGLDEGGRDGGTERWRGGWKGVGYGGRVESREGGRERGREGGREEEESRERKWREDVCFVRFLPIEGAHSYHAHLREVSS